MRSQTTKKEDPNYLGVNMSSKWDTRAACSTVRMMIKKEGKHKGKFNLNYLYNKPCTVSRALAPLPGNWARYDAFSISWKNGVAARAFVNGERSLQIMGFSTDGIPDSWNE